MTSYDLLIQHNIQVDFWDYYIQQLLKNHQLHLITDVEFIQEVNSLIRKQKIDKVNGSG